MRRALQLALNGEGRVSPNPMVGAVIVHDNRIIGEGFHNFYGGPHAEVNAINSVKPEDWDLLKDSTMYVTLEPCAHHGKTPPCANLIVDTGIPRVVIATLDPNPKVAGKGVKILEEAGIKVKKGILESEAVEINRKFLFSQNSDRPYIILKWAQSKDGFLAGKDSDNQPYRVMFSSSLSSVWVHRLRASSDAILVGGNTQKIDNPLLNNRLWGGNSPKKFVVHFNDGYSLPNLLEQMRKDGITSLIVEGGAQTLKSFIDQNLYDEIRIEYSPVILNKGLKAPIVPEDIMLCDRFFCRDNTISVFRR